MTRARMPSISPTSGTRMRRAHTRTINQSMSSRLRAYPERRLRGKKAVMLSLSKHLYRFVEYYQTKR
jgi:hypothetical protein